MLDKMNKNGAYSISIMIMFTAITLLCLFIGYMLPSARVIFYFVASLFSYCIMCEQSFVMGLISLGAVVILGLLIFPSPMLVLPYILFFGHYGMFKYYLDEKKQRNIMLIYKLVYFNIALVLIYLIYPGFFTENLPAEMPLWFLAAIMEAGFLLYDFIYSVWAKFYINVLRRMLKNSTY